jgi:hypothetical protein
MLKNLSIRAGLNTMIALFGIVLVAGTGVL